jgi:hypothetical protein
MLWLMTFNGGKLARHYWMICDHKMLGYYAMFKGLGQLQLKS